MIVKRPSIFIYANNPDKGMLKEICAGIEEEGVFFEIFEKDSDSLDDLAFNAANDSMLGSGIGIKGNSAVLQMKGVKKGKNVASVNFPNDEDCRIIGANSARIIKKMPLK